ncbi:MAG: type II CAAX endopeptidase family protein [Desulfobacterales bacterium]
MTTRTPRPTSIWATVLLAFFLWFIAFYLTLSIFWFKIAAAAAILAGLSILLQPGGYDRVTFSRRSIMIGLASAVILYGIFYLGKTLSTAILPFAPHQIGGIYGKGTGTPVWIILPLLFFITGPAEEFYWRGFLQKNLMLRHGQFRGWLLTTAIYAGVHIWSFNFMLIGAAAVAGAFWGFMYWRLKDLSPVIISHAVWSSVIFAVVPMN